MKIALFQDNKIVKASEVVDVNAVYTCPYCRIPLKLKVDRNCITHVMVPPLLWLIDFCIEIGYYKSKSLSLLESTKITSDILMN